MSEENKEAVVETAHAPAPTVAAEHTVKSKKKRKKKKAKVAEPAPTKIDFSSIFIWALIVGLPIVAYFL